MKGISYITDDKNRKKALVIDLKMIEKDADDIYDVIDLLVAESRRSDESVDWQKAKKQLVKKGKL